MKHAFKVIEIEYESKIIYKKGSVEIDDEARETTLKANKTLSIFGLILPIGQSEILLEKTKYDAKNFPQFEDDKLEIGLFSFIVPNEEDRVRITEIYLKPLFELRNKIEEELTKVEMQVKELLLRRAQALEYIGSLRSNPRKTLFTCSPEILENFEDPVQAAIQQQRDAIAASLCQLKEELAFQIKTQNLHQSNIGALQKLAIAVGAIQNALFEGTQEKVSSAIIMLKTIRLTIQEGSSISVKSLTEELMEQFIVKMHQKMLEDQLGITRCSCCGKYFPLNADYCTYCKTVMPQK